MPITYRQSTQEKHEALPKRKATTAKDPVWENVMELLEQDNVVELDYADEKERGTLARSVGRRAAHRGFRVDIKHGDGFLSVVKAGDVPMEQADLAEAPVGSPDGRPKRRRNATEEAEAANAQEEAGGV